MVVEGYPGLAALLAPYAVMLLAIVAAGRGARRRAGSASAVTATGRYGAPVGRRDRGPGAADIAVEWTARAAASKVRATVAKTPAVAPLPSLEAVLGDLGRAEAASDERRIAELSLTVAEVHLAAGRDSEAAEALRRAIRIAVRLDLKPVHARARIELGDIARQSGDLTTACEHWQIARGLYHEAGNVRALDGAETRMRDHGCPTDWVLNDF